MSHSHASSSHESHGNLPGHILPMKIYVNVLLALFFFTGITVAVAYQDFTAITGIPGMNIIIAMLIASVKALLVALFFMHLKYENPLTWLYAIFPIILLFFLIGGVFLDNPFRIDGRGAGSTTKPVVSAPVSHEGGAHH